MHPSTRELLQHLDESLEGLRDALAAIPAEHHETRPDEDGWSAANVMSHLARTEGQVAAFLERALRRALSDDSLPAAADTSSVLATMDTTQLLDRANRLVAPDFAAPDAAMTAADAYEALVRARARTSDVLLAGDGLDTSSLRREHHVLGNMTFAQWIAFVGFHQQRHTAQLRELADRLAGW